MMNKFFTAFLVILLLFAHSAHAAEHTVLGTITENTAPYMCIIDEYGEKWAIEYDAQYVIGQVLIVTFDDNNTSYLYDDEVTTLHALDE